MCDVELSVKAWPALSMKGRAKESLNKRVKTEVTKSTAKILKMKGT